MGSDVAERSGRPGAFLSAEETARVTGAISAAESLTSGEIRVVVSRKAGRDALEAARRTFFRLGMQGTAERNGVLILLATTSRTFAIYGDEGVHRFIGHEGWDNLRNGMAECFRRNDFAAGLVYAVEGVGRVLREHFPRQHGDSNELPDGVVEE